MSNLLSRIQEIASNEGITIGAMERTIGASKGVLSRAINNSTDIQAKWLQIISDNYPHYSADWLLSGRGSMLRSDQALMESQPAAQPIDSTIYYNMYKEEKVENKALIEEIGALKERLRQLETVQETTQSIKQQKQSESVALIEESPDAFTQDSPGGFGKDASHMRKPASSQISSVSKT